MEPSLEEQQKVWDILSDDSLSDDEKDEAFMKLPESLRQWSTTAIHEAFLDGSSQKAVKPVAFGHANPITPA